MPLSHNSFRTIRGESGQAMPLDAQRERALSPKEFLAPVEEKSNKKSPRTFQTVKGLTTRPQEHVETSSPIPPSPHKAIDVLGPDA